MRTHGDRHLLFLAVGPGFKENVATNRRRNLIDVAPTIGTILGFPVPYADGLVMAELLKGGSLATDVRTGGQRRISLSASASGVHVVWSQKRGSE